MSFSHYITAYSDLLLIFGQLLYGVALFIVIRKYKRNKMQCAQKGEDYMHNILIKVNSSLPETIINYILKDGTLSVIEQLSLMASGAKIEVISHTKEVVNNGKCQEPRDIA